MNKFIAKTLDDRERVSKEFFPSKRTVPRSELKAWATELQNKANARPRKAERVLNKMLKELGIEVIE